MCGVSFAICSELFGETYRFVPTSTAFGAHLAVTQFECYQDVWRQKTIVPGLLHGTVSMILHLAVLVKHRFVTDTERQTRDDSIYRAI